MNSGCYMNGNLVGALIYANDITLMGPPTRSSILSLLNECDDFARKHDIWFNRVKTNCIFPHHLLTLFPVKCYHV